MINNRGGKIIEVMILWGEMMMIFNEIKRVEEGRKCVVFCGSKAEILGGPKIPR